MSAASARGVVRVVTGRRGSGKTTFCRVLVDRVRSHCADLVPAGVLSQKILLRGREVGIEVIDLTSGQRRRLATRRDRRDPTAGPCTVRWCFNADALAWGDAVLRRATPCGLLIVDEVGPLEFERGEGWMGALAAVDSGSYDFAFVVVRAGLVERALERWPEARAVLIDDATDAEASARRSAVDLCSRSSVHAKRLREDSNSRHPV